MLGVKIRYETEVIESILVPTFEMKLTSCLVQTQVIKYHDSRVAPSVVLSSGEIVFADVSRLKN